MSNINFTQVEPGARGQFIYEPNGVVVCDVWMDVDGYWKSDGACGRGFMEAHHHRMIADKLDEINAAYKAQLKAYFDALPKEIDTAVQDDETPF
jgi:hypothetical protein